MHGKGVFEDYNYQLTYTGDMNNGQITGSGKLTFSDGSEYEGNFVRGKFEGEGQFTLQPNSNLSQNRAMFFGSFKNHKRDGEGTMLDEVQNDIYSGLWVQDKPQSKGLSSLTQKMPEFFIEV